jgi:GT2 family glycosyltransferase
LNWNGAEVLPKAFPSVLRLNYPNYEVIFVDNGSDDNSADMAKEIAEGAGREIRAIRHEENVGYNRGKNAGAAAARGKYLWLLDNDIEVEPDALSILVEFMEAHPNCGLAGPLLYNPTSDRREGSGMLFLCAGVPLEIHKVRRRVSDEAPVTVGSILGGVTFVRHSAWTAVGGYEPSAMFAMDDADLGPRVWAAGGTVAMVPRAVTIHHALSRGTRHRQRWGFRQYIVGASRAMLRNCRVRTLLTACPLFVVFLVLKSIKRAAANRDVLPPFQLVPGLWRVLCGLPESLRQRRAVQAQRRVLEDRHFHPDRYWRTEELQNG